MFLVWRRSVVIPVNSQGAETDALFAVGNAAHLTFLALFFWRGCGGSSEEAFFFRDRSLSHGNSQSVCRVTLCHCSTETAGCKGLGMVLDTVDDCTYSQM